MSVVALKTAPAAGARQRLASALSARGIAKEALAAAEKAHQGALYLQDQAQAAQRRVMADERSAGSDLAETIKAALKGGGTVGGYEPAEHGLARHTAESRVATATAAVDALAGELQGAREALRQAEHDVDSCTAGVLAEEAEALVARGLEALEVLRATHRALVSIGNVGPTVMPGGGLAPLRLSPDAVRLSSWSAITSGAESEAPTVRAARAQQWRDFRRALLTDPSAQAPNP